MSTATLFTIIPATDCSRFPALPATRAHSGLFHIRPEEHHHGIFEVLLIYSSTISILGCMLLSFEANNSVVYFLFRTAFSLAHFGHPYHEFIMQVSLVYRLFDVVTPNTIEMKLYRLCDSLGIQRRSPHKARKTYISNLINNGADLDYVRTQARHKDLNTTLKSYVYSTSATEEKVALLNEVL